MAITDSIKWHIEEVNYELTRNAECKEIFIYQRGDNLPQFFHVREASALCMQIRRMMNRSEFVMASKGWTDKKKGA